MRVLKGFQRLTEIENYIIDWLTSRQVELSEHITTSYLLDKLIDFCEKAKEEADEAMERANIAENNFAGMIDRSITEVVIPDSVTTIGAYAFHGCKISDLTIPNNVKRINAEAFSKSSLISVTISSSVTYIDWRAFYQCANLKNVDIQNNVIGNQMFNTCSALEELIIPENVSECGNYALQSCASLKRLLIYGNCLKNSYGLTAGCTSLEYLYLSNRITSVEWRCFNELKNLTTVDLEQGFNASLNISASTLYSVETLVAMLEALADLTGQTAKTLTIGSTNLAKLTDEQKAIATNKNWTLA